MTLFAAVYFVLLKTLVVSLVKQLMAAFLLGLIWYIENQ